MSPPHLHLVIPGPLGQRTGGYLYDARMTEELRGAGWRVAIHSLEGRFPDPDSRARESLERTLAGIPDGSRVLLDGLGMGGLPDKLRAHRRRLRLLGLVHHPLGDETGLGSGERERLHALERKALAACQGIVVTSDFTATRVVAMGVARAKIRVAPPGSRATPAAVGPGLDHPPRLLCVASVIPRKGHDVLVNALARIRNLPWTCVCVGSLRRDPPFALAVRQTVAREGLEGRIRFPGEAEEGRLEGLYHRASLLVLASHYEGYGMVLTEAMGRGLPVVSTTGGAIPFTVPSEAGLLVPPGDPQVLAAALRRLLAGTPESERMRREMSAAARHHATSLPNWAQAGATFARSLLELSVRADGIPESDPILEAPDG